MGFRFDCVTGVFNAHAIIFLNPYLHVNIKTAEK